MKVSFLNNPVAKRQRHSLLRDRSEKIFLVQGDKKALSEVMSIRKNGRMCQGEAITGEAITGSIP